MKTRTTVKMQEIAYTIDFEDEVMMAQPGSIVVADLRDSITIPQDGDANGSEWEEFKMRNVDHPSKLKETKEKNQVKL